MDPVNVYTELVSGEVVVPDLALERALDAYADRIIDTSDGLTAPERHAEAMRAAIITAVGGTRE